MPTLKKIEKFRVTITLKTGLHIGGIKDSYEIGGADSPVIRGFMLRDGEVKSVPIIPGSSIKGKMRSLLEMTTEGVIFKRGENSDKVGETYIEYEGKALTIRKMFGVGADKKSEERNITRLIVRDALPTESTLKFWRDAQDVVDGAVIKGENSINRITSVANPRFIERVPEGSVFETEFVLLVLDNDDEEELEETLKRGVQLLESNYIGGHGSRGYGRISIKMEEMEG